MSCCKECEKNTHRIVIIDDRLLPSIMRDAVTFFMLIGLVAVGWWMSSKVLEFIGAILFVVFVTSDIGGRGCSTIDEARRELDRLEDGR